MANLLEALRQHTTDIHQAMHRHPLLEACVAKRLDQQGYRHLLRAFYTPWVAVAPHIATLAIPALKAGLNLRLKALREDLIALGVDIERVDVERVDVKDVELEPVAVQAAEANAPSPIFNTPDQYLGACYVLVGSTLGATTLKECVHHTNSALPLGYLSVTPQQAGWPPLVAHLKAMPAGAHPEVCTAAQQTFQMIYSQLGE